LQQLIDLGGVCLNGQVLVKASTRSRPRIRGMIELRPTPQSQAFKAEAMALDVVYVDEVFAGHQQTRRPGGPSGPGNWAGT